MKDPYRLSRSFESTTPTTTPAEYESSELPFVHCERGEQMPSKEKEEDLQFQFRQFCTQSSDKATKYIKELHTSITESACNLTDPSNYPLSYDPIDNEQFDFIVVGAGSAGSVIAYRLSEHFSVLLIEAGGDPTVATEVPALFSSLQQSEVDWAYLTDPDDDSIFLGFERNQSRWTKGKVLGGSSTINGLYYARGSEKDYNDWAAAGNVGWSYEEVLPYFKKSERMQAPEVLAMDDETSKYHGMDGNLVVESMDLDFHKELVGTFKNGMSELGYPEIFDCNRKKQTGYVKLQATTIDGRRCSTAKAFLSVAKDRSNLKVSKHSLATKLLINNMHSCYGVEFINKGKKTIHVTARKEVIVSAGAIGSPQLLMLSGIGPRPHLEFMNISVVEDAPVGENLQDHPQLINLLITANISVPRPDVKYDMFDFLVRNSGLFRSPQWAGNLPQISLTDPISDYADVQIHPAAFNEGDKKGISCLLSYYNVRSDYKQYYTNLNKNATLIFMIASLLKPYSKGKILLRSANATDMPRIRAGYLSDERDQEAFLKIYEFMEEFVQTEAMKKIGARFHELRVPGCEQYPHGSLEYRKCSFKHMTSTSYDIAGTCKMGPLSDPTAVVSPTLRVHNITNLRVADASVMPSVVRGNINAPVIMIGEKAADMILSSATATYS